MKTTPIYKRIKKILRNTMTVIVRLFAMTVIVILGRTRQGVDKHASLRYNGSRPHRSFFAAVLRRLHQTIVGTVPLNPNRKDLVMKTFQAYFGRLTAMSLLLTAALLTACGGGGSGATTVAPPPPTPIAGNLSITVTPTDGATGVARDTKVVLTYASSTNSYASSTGTLSCDGTSITLAQSTDQTTKKVTFAPASVFPYGKTCISQGTSTASGLDGGASTIVSWKTTFTTEQITCKVGEQPSADGQTCVLVPCPTGTTLTNGVCVANAWWPPKNVTPMGVKVFGTEFSQLPAGCTSVYATPFTPSSGFSACWKEFVTTNKMKWVQTSQTMVGTTPSSQATRPIIFAAFVTPTGRYQVITMYADTGDNINPFGDIDGQVAHDVIDFVVGNDRGYILREKTTGNCWQWRWNPPTTTPGVSSNVWDFQSASCPQ